MCFYFLILTVDPKNGALPANDSSLPPLLEPPQRKKVVPLAQTQNNFTVFSLYIFVCFFSLLFILRFLFSAAAAALFLKLSLIYGCYVVIISKTFFSFFFFLLYPSLNSVGMKLFASLRCLRYLFRYPQDGQKEVGKEKCADVFFRI